MADNPLVKGAAGVSFRPLSDEVVTRNGAALDQDNVQAQVIKIAIGGDGIATDVSTTAPFPTQPTTAGDVAATLTNGRKTSTTVGAAVALRSTLACKWVLVTALATNTSRVAIGGAGVIATVGAETGVPLAAGESVTIPTADAAAVFLDVLVSGEGVRFLVGA